MHYPRPLHTLIDSLKKLPGVGTKTAERFAFQMLDWTEGELKEFADHLSHLKSQLTSCSTCGCLIEKESCQYCNLDRRDPSQICVVSSPRDVFLFEESHLYKGCYHVTNGLISPLEERYPQSMRFDALKERVIKQETKELIIGFDSTIEGDATALYLKELFADHPVKISRLAFGIPVGSSLEYIDEGTLIQSFSGRTHF
ncbi:MAG: Recombination protein RecR [Chlamydiia bacterium]|nr:Recombination protein RecR [Chlamydiia bacterium]